MTGTTLSRSACFCRRGGFGGFVLALMALVTSPGLHAEGSGLLGTNQYFLDFTQSASYGLDAYGTSQFVDILSAGEVINISACGISQYDDLQFRIYDSADVLVDSITLSSGNVSCTDPMTGPLGSPHRYVTTKADTFRLELENLNQYQFMRLDITVTPNVLTNPDPTERQGRLWAYSWNMNTGTFAESGATDADIYALVPGGRPDTQFIWKLDLNRFSGNLYFLMANSLGVESPYSGYSVPSSLGSGMSYEYPQYLSVPAQADSQPANPPVLSNSYFVDNDNEDLAFSPHQTNGIQDTGTFHFTSDITGNYAIYIDLNRDGIMGNGGDRTLVGPASVGDNAVAWDGLDASGNPVPAGRYGVSVSVRAGEYHFVAIDVETSGGTSANGLTIWLTDPDGTDNPVRVFWDDYTVLDGANDTASDGVTPLPVGSANTPDGALSGTVAGYHTWGNFAANSLGDLRYIDTYVYGMEGKASALVEVKNDDSPATGYDGSVSSVTYFSPGESPVITVTDADLNILLGVAETVYVSVANNASGEVEQVLLTETGTNTGVFTGPYATATPAVVTSNDGVLEVSYGDVITVTYADQLSSSGDTASLTASSTVSPDTDGDGIYDPDETDDSDNDGILDVDEGYGTVDTDADGTPDHLDSDSDNDGIADSIEGAGDKDGDLIADYRDPDSDADGIADSVEGAVDTDMDGVADYLDADSDADGIADSAEGVVDTDGDGLADFLDTDSDGDGIPDSTEGVGDSDADGIADYRDTDADGDGVIDALEGSGDTDGDGTPNYLDGDSDGDGLGDALEANADSDGDGIADRLESDSDNDGLSDSLEGTLDNDGDGLANYRDTDSDADGISDAVEGSGDTDADGTADYLDSDSDADGISDSLEGAADVDGDGIANFRDGDSDGDGLSDALEGSADTDGDGTLSIDEFVKTVSLYQLE